MNAESTSAITTIAPMVLNEPPISAIACTDQKRKRQVIEADLLPDEVQDAATRLAKFASIRAEHEIKLKAAAKDALGGVTEESLKETIKAFCRRHRDIQDIRTGPAIVKAVLTKSSQSNLNEGSVMKLVSRCIDMTAAIQREKKIQRLHEVNTLTKEDAENIVEDMGGIDSIELLKCVNQEMQKMKTVAERYAISFDIKNASASE